MTPSRGDVWWAELEDKRRPVLVLTRNAAIPVLRSFTVAPLTRTVRGIPTEVQLDESDGMPQHCVVTLDNIRQIPAWALTQRITRLDAVKLRLVCAATNVAIGC